ncbi:MAG: flagellin [Bryobacteraceae bacterium]
MLPAVNGPGEQFLTDLDQIQSAMNTVQRQLSSGLRVGQASDDPSAVPSILELQSEIAQNTQAQTNLNQVKTELLTGDASLQQAVTLVEQATTLAAQAASGTSTDTQNASLAAQIQGIQQQLVNLSNTTVGGRYIFSGDSDEQAAYALDSTQPNGVRQLSPATSTMAITDVNGNTLWKPMTAQQIFDARNTDGSNAAGNVFAAVNSLLTALQNNDSSAATASVESLNAADDYLNQQLGLIGIAEDRVENATTAASQSVTTETADLGTLRDADTAGDAIQLSQLNTQQQAALSARATMSQSNLFDFLA